MMVIRTFTVALLTTLLFAACKKPSDTLCLDIVSPINNLGASPVFTTFTWRNCQQVPTHFVLSADSNFSSAIRDFREYITSYTLDTILSPNKKYFWYIGFGDILRSGSFITSGTSDKIAGIFPGEAQTDNYAFINDTFYAYTLQIKDVGNNEILMSIPGVDTAKLIFKYTTDSSILYYCKPCTGFYNYNKYLQYYPRSGRVVVDFQTKGDLRGWHFAGTKPI
ncbi:MAG: hypothetical protein H0X33_07980 [Taibaiella sp.]|nr:hypothetical protein [Taibaiella sp.]